MRMTSRLLSEQDLARCAPHSLRSLVVFPQPQLLDAFWQTRQESLRVVLVQLDSGSGRMITLVGWGLSLGTLRQLQIVV